MRLFFISLSYFLLYLIAGQVSLYFTSLEPFFIPFWLPSSLMFLGIVKYGKIQLPGIAIASFINIFLISKNIIEPNSTSQLIFPCLIASAFTCLQVFFMAQLFDKEINRQLLSPKSPTPFNSKFIFLRAMPLCALSPTIGIICFLSANLIETPLIMSTWLVWYWAELAGIIFIVPLASALRLRPQSSKERSSLITCGLVSLLIYVSLMTTQLNKQNALDQQQFTNQSESIQHELAHSLQQVSDQLEFFVHSNNQHELSDLANFEKLAAVLIKQSPHIKQVSLIQKVPHAELTEHLSQLTLTYGENYQIFETEQTLSLIPSSPRSVHYPIIASYPAANSIIGYDLASDPESNTALDFAHQTSDATAGHMRNPTLTQADKPRTFLFQQVPSQKQYFIALKLDHASLIKHLFTIKASGTLEFFLYKFNGLEYLKTFDSRFPHGNHDRHVTNHLSKNHALSFGQQLWYMHFIPSQAFSISASSPISIIQIAGLFCIILLFCLISESSVHNDRTAQLLLQRNKQLKTSEKRVVDTSRSKNNFISNLSYRMRTPMTSIVGYADLLKNPDITLKERQQFSDIIRDQSTSMLNEIDDTLDMIKIENNTFELNEAKFSTLRLADLLRKHFSQECFDKRLLIKTSFPLVEHLNADFDRIIKALITLCELALKKSPNDTVLVKISSSEVAGTHYLNLQVQEPDTSLSHEELALIKDQFSGLNHNIAKQVDVAGLGLTLCHHLARILGGRLIFKSDDTQFTIELQLRIKNKKPSFIYKETDTISPSHDNLAENEVSSIHEAKTNEKSTEAKSQEPDAAIAQQDPKDQVTTSEPTTTSKPEIAQILLVEDNKNNSRLISLMIKKLGYGVHCCYNGQQALDAVIATPNAWDLIIMDMKMPIMDGCTAARRIRDLAYNKPILALSANASIQDRQDCLESGYNDFASKPIVKAKLAELISIHLNLSY